MKSKEPWKPQKPKTKPRCKHCHGKGQVIISTGIFGFDTESKDCHVCGGKGYV